MTVTKEQCEATKNHILNNMLEIKKEIQDVKLELTKEIGDIKLHVADTIADTLREIDNDYARKESVQLLWKVVIGIVLAVVGGSAIIKYLV